MVVASWNLSRGPNAVHFKGGLLTKTRHDVADQWNRDHGAGENVESEAKLQEKVAATEIAISISTSEFGGVLGFVRAHRSAFLLPLGQREGLPKFILSLRHQPGHNAGNLLFGHRLSRNPVLKIRTP